MKRNLLRLVFLLFFFVLAAILYGTERLKSWSISTRTLSEPTSIEIPRGIPLARLATDLERGGVIDDALLFRVWVKYYSDFSQFQAGTYRFTDAVSPAEIAHTAISGSIYEPVIFQVTIPEGFTVQKVIDRLVGKGVGTKDQVRKLAVDPPFIESLQVPSKTLEGFLYPATYSFTVQPTAREVLTKMVTTFWERLPKNYEKDIQKQGLSLLQAVTFASLIELETRLEEEKPKVSEVIWNRLKSKVALAIDASIIYGIPGFDGNLRWKHLKDRTNPYNSRVHRGLPPTPIGSPSRSSLEAVLRPTNAGYFYYVLDLKDGSRHHFSKSLKEHNKHVRELNKERKRRKNKPN